MAADGDDPGTCRPEPVGPLPFFTVAIGAAAGGLHAFREFLNHLPPDTGMPFVLIQHLDPIHKSLLAVLHAGAAFDRLFTDVVMPEGLSGYDLADLALVLRPGLKRLFTTGYAGLPPLEADKAWDQQVLHKPYRLTERAKTLRVVLDAA